MARIISDEEASRILNDLHKMDADRKVVSELLQDIKEAEETRKNRHLYYRSDYNKVKYSHDKISLWEIPGRLDYCRVKDGTSIVVNGFEGPPYPPMLKGIVFPDSVRAIASKSFSGYKELEYVNFGNGLKIIGEYAFKDCKRLKVIILPEGLLSIGKGTFYGNESLEVLYIPDSVQFIGEDVITGCNKVKVYISREHSERITHLLSGRFKIKESGYSSWETDRAAQADRAYENELSSLGKSDDYWYDDMRDLERDNWYAMTDGMYGDYPDEGYDWDYESIGVD